MSTVARKSGEKVDVRGQKSVVGVAGCRSVGRRETRTNVCRWLPAAVAFLDNAAWRISATLSARRTLRCLIQASNIIDNVVFLEFSAAGGGWITPPVIVRVSAAFLQNTRVLRDDQVRL